MSTSTLREPSATQPPPRPAGSRLERWVDERLGIAHFARSALNKIFPDNWSFMLGEVALYSFIILVLTGIYLTLFFIPSNRAVVYNGSYAPLRGISMSEAYQSTIGLSFDVRAGLVFRQIHHWAALLFIAAVVTHLCRIFFTGAFRKPRELNWLVGVTLLILAIVNGFAGYSLPDDLLSGTGLRIAYSVSLAIPIVGTWLTFLVFGGNYPSDAITTRLYIAHVLLVPAAIAILLSAHLAILWRQKHTQFPGRGRTEHNVVGSRLWPTYAARSIGLFAAVLAILCGLGGLAQINPVWLYGPYKPFSVSTAAQPDWYLGWLEGAIRLFPGWRISIFGYPLSELFWPAILLPGLTFGALYMWPFIERRVTGDRQPHHLLDRPRNTPVRTAIGAAVLAFYIVLVFAGSQDIIAQHLSVGIPSVTYTFRALVLILPALAALLAWRLCHDLSASDRRIETGPEDWPPMLPPAGAERPAVAGQERPAGHAGDTGEEGAPPVPHQRSRWSRVARLAGAALTGAAAVGAYVAGRRSSSQQKAASR